VFVVTGASTGIGRAIVLELVRRGEHVLAGVRNETDANKISELCSNLAGRAEPVSLDVTKESDLTAFEITLSQQKNPLKGLINNAGIVMTGPLEIMPINKVKQMFEVNVFGLLRVTQICLPFLRTAKGRIVNMSSISGLTVTPVLSPYCASKHCVEVFSDALRMELRPWGIEVCLIEPGSISTPIWEKSLKGSSSELRILPKEKYELYEGLLNRFEKLALAIAKRASSPDVVVEKTMHALFSRKPKTRYIVGSGARQALIQNWLPDRWRDALVLKYLRTP
jgi:short-subunit dehydrogenase